MQTIEGKRFVRIALTGGIAAGKALSRPEWPKTAPM